MRILLVQPAPFEDARLGLENTFWLSVPVGLTSIGTMVKDDHEVQILDMRLEEPAKLPDLLGLSSHHRVHMLQGLLGPQRGMDTAEHDLPPLFPKAARDLIGAGHTGGLGGECYQVGGGRVVDLLRVLVHQRHLHICRGAGRDGLESEVYKCPIQA